MTVRTREDEFGDLARRHDLVSLATSAAMFLGHFSRPFRRADGETPHPYVTARRIEQSLTLLRANGQPVTCLRVEVGFRSVTSLVTRFRQGGSMQLTSP